MRLWIWIVIIIAAPFYLISQAQSGQLDATTTLVVIGLVILSIAAITKQVRDAQAAKAQRDFWLSQRK